MLRLNLGLAFALLVPLALPAAAWGVPSWREPQVGDELRYAQSSGEVTTTKVVRVRSEGPAIVAMLERLTETAGRRVVTHLSLVRNEGGLSLALDDPGDLPLERSAWLCLASTARVHDTWTAQQGRYRTAAGDVVAYRVTARLEAIETLKVPAGTFAGCYRVTFLCEVPPEGAAAGAPLEMWIKPELGIVRTRRQEHGAIAVTELVDYQCPGYRP